MAKLDFNSEGVEDAPSFDLLPDNTTVLCTLTESDVVENKKGDGSYLKLTFESADDAHPGRKFWENLNLFTQRDDDKAKKMVAIASAKLAGLVRACGKVAVGDSEELHGIPVLLTLGVEPARGEWPAKNTIKKFSSPSGETKKPVSSGKPVTGEKSKPAWAR